MRNSEIGAGQGIHGGESSPAAPAAGQRHAGEADMADREMQHLRDELGDNRKSISRQYDTILEGHYTTVMLSRPRPELGKGSLDMFTINEYEQDAAGNEVRHAATHTFETPMDALAFANDLRRMALIWAEKQVAYESAEETGERIERERQ
jgi:hypothetical protein